jgi:hypothetical protein
LFKKTACFYEQAVFLWVETDIHTVGGLTQKYSQLGIIDGMQEGSIFGEKYVPRGTLLWNGYAQYLVCCGKLFLVGAWKVVELAREGVRNGGTEGEEFIQHFNVGLRTALNQSAYVSQPLFCF